jgi:pimeloyl-ACP methyl ester carboxylesterase
MPTFEHKSLTAHYIESGAGDPAVLLHAGGSSGRQWRKMGTHLDADYRLIAPDLYGFGDTEAWPGPGELTHDAQADLVRSLIERMCDVPVHIVGHSYGGATAMRLCLAAPELIRSLVFIEPILTPLLPQAGEEMLFAEYRSFAEAFIRRAEEGHRDEAWRDFLDLRNGEGTWERLSDEARQRFIDQTDRAAVGFKSNLSNPTTLADCRGITVPTLIVCGANTTAPEKRVTEILRDEIPNCVYEVIPDAEHMSPLTHPAMVAKLIRRHWETNS